MTRFSNENIAFEHTATKIAISRIHRIQRTPHWIPCLKVTLSEVFHSESDRKPSG